MKHTGLTLKEAVESGRPFRHKSWAINKDRWTIYKDGKTRFTDSIGDHWWSPHNIDMKHALSSDWEIQVKQTFTREELERAILFALREANYCPHRDLKTTIAFSSAITAADGAGGE